MGESFKNTSYLSLSKNEICHDISPNSTIIYDYYINYDRENADTPGDLDIIKDPILVMSQSAFLWPQKNHQRRYFSLGLRCRRLELPTAARGSAKRPPHPGEKDMKHPVRYESPKSQTCELKITYKFGGFNIILYKNQWKSPINLEGLI